jgi:hypothetical protein
MVAEQRETVQRIDADTMDIASNVSGAQRELLKYYASISSNRWLMLKVFGVLIVFVSLHYYKARKADDSLRSIEVPYFHPRVIICSAAGCVCKYIYRTLFYKYATRYTVNNIVAKRPKDKELHGQPTGMAFTPVPNCFACLTFLPALECFCPPRCVFPSSSSPTVHVRFPAAACSMPDVVENRWGRSGSIETCSSLLPDVASFSDRFFCRLYQAVSTCAT